MSDFPITPNSDVLANGRSLAVPEMRPETAAARLGHTFACGIFRPRQQLPVYCHPVALFLAVWLLMLVCLSLRVSYVTYPGFGTPVLIFAVSTLAFLLGFSASTAVLPDEVPGGTASYALDVTVLRRINLLLCFISILIIVLNWAIDGPPPALGDPAAYLTYGRLKQILFPVVTTVAVNSMFDPSRFRRFLFQAFSAGVLIAYMSRGALLNTFLQVFFVASLRTSISKRKQCLLALGSFAFAIAGFTVFGNLRTAHDLFISFLQIRDKYSEWPMAFLWFVAYVSIPFSNLCWIVAHGTSHGPTFAFLNSLLPSFMAESAPYPDVYGSINIIDNASTYLQAYALDFSYLGIYFTNLLIGLGCGWLVRRSYPRHILILAIFLPAVSLLFFTDMFFLLSTVIQVCIQASVQKRCFQWNS